MNIHEYQAKELLRGFGVPVPFGVPVLEQGAAQEAYARVFAETGSPVAVVKAQIHAGGRGKAGGVKVVRDETAFNQAVADIWGKTLVTHQTGAEGKKVGRLLVEQGLDIKHEYYLAIVLDRDSRRYTLIASAEGGVEIEEVAEATPEAIHQLVIDPITGLQPFHARRLAFSLGLGKHLWKSWASLLSGLYEAAVASDAMQVEINPLIETGAGTLLALDAKVNLDENASFRHAEWQGWRDPNEEDAVEAEAAASGLSYVSMDGNIGCLVNGAGLAMATMDIIKHYGGEPANFLDVGGGATQESVTKAFEMILSSPAVRGIFVNIFGGIMRCDVIAEGIIGATRALGLKVPLVVRLQGTRAAEGRELLAGSGLALVPVETMDEGAKRIVELVK